MISPVRWYPLREELRKHILCFHPIRKTQRKGQDRGDEKGRLFCTGPDLKMNKKNTVSLELVVLLRSTNQHLQPGLTRGQENAWRPPALAHNNILVFLCYVNHVYIVFEANSQMLWYWMLDSLSWFTVTLDVFLCLEAVAFCMKKYSPNLQGLVNIMLVIKSCMCIALPTINTV